MLAAVIAIAILPNLGARTVLAEPAPIEQPFHAAPDSYATHALGDPMVAEGRVAAGGRYHLQLNAAAPTARPVGKADYDQEPESISRGTEP